MVPVPPVPSEELPLNDSTSSDRTLAGILDAIDAAPTSAARLQVAAVELHAFGFDRVLITVRDEAMNPVQVASAEGVDSAGLPLNALPGAVWRRLLQPMERFRDGDLYVLDGRDPWVAREFFGLDPAPADAPDGPSAADLVVGVMRAPDGGLLGFVKVASPQGGTLAPARREAVGIIVRHLAARLAFDALERVARQRQERLQLLQESGASLTRSLDEQEIFRELTRQVQRIVRSDGVVILIPDLAADRLTVARHVVDGGERDRPPQRLGDGLVAEVARRGLAVRLGDRESDLAREKAGHPVIDSLQDITGEDGVHASAVAVPIRVGLRLLGVLAVYDLRPDVFDAEDEEVLATMASQAATAIANARRYAESERERRTTEALAEVARAVGESLRLGEVLRLILRHSVSLLGVEGACIALREADYLHIVAAIGTAEVLSGLHLPVASSLLGNAITSNELIALNAVDAQTPLNRTVRQLARIDRTMLAPLMTGRGTIGGLAVINRDRPFDADDGRVLQRLADQVSVAIVNARLFEEVERITRQWKLAFDNTASGIVVLEESQVVGRCNARAAELCGTSIAGLLGRRFSEALIGSPGGASAELDRQIAEALQLRQVSRTEARGIEGIPYRLVIAPHPDGGCVVTFDDLTTAL